MDRITYGAESHVNETELLEKKIPFEVKLQLSVRSCTRMTTVFGCFLVLRFVYEISTGDRIARF